MDGSASARSKAGVKVPSGATTIPRPSLTAELNRRIKHYEGTRQRLRDEGALSIAAIDTARIDELTDFLQWTKAYQ